MIHFSSQLDLFEGFLNGREHLHFSLLLVDAFLLNPWLIDQVTSTFRYAVNLFFFYRQLWRMSGL